MTNIKVSIIVALYNKEMFIKKCLTSLINQSLKEIEIIVINDCSTDNSLEICKSFNDKRIKIINNKINYGIGYTRNVGIKKAIGEFIAFVDADDFVDIDMYEQYYDFCIYNNLDMLNANYYKINNGKKEIFKVPSFSTTNISSNHNIINLINYGPCNKLFRRKTIVDNNIIFDENNKYEDMIFVANAIKHSNLIGYSEKAYYNYVIHINSETTIVDDRVFDIFKVMNKINNIYDNLKGTNELTYLNVVEITRYMLKQKYQTNKKNKVTFINRGYDYLDSIDNNWRNNVYYKKEQFIKRIVKNNKTIMKLYCKI